MTRRKQQLDDVLQDCLDRIENGASIEACLREYPSYASELAPLLEAAQQVRNWRIPQQRGAARDAVKARARAALAAQQLTTSTARSSGWYHAGRLVWRYAAALAFVFALFGTSVAAAQDDLPGDLLYSVKRGSEHVRLGLARTPSTRAGLYLDFAQRRLNECLALSEAQRSLDGSLAAVEDEYAQAWEAINLVPPEERAALVERYQQDVQIQQEVLSTALRNVPSEASRSALLEVLEVIRAAQRRADRLNNTAVPQVTPTVQNNNVEMSPTPVAGETVPAATTETVPVVTVTTLKMTVTPAQPTSQVESRTATALQSSQPSPTQPAETITRIQTVTPTPRTGISAPTQPAAQTSSPYAPPIATRVPTTYTPPSPQPTNDARPSPEATKVPSPRIDEPTPTPEPIETPADSTPPSPQPTIVQPSPEVTEAPRVDEPMPTPEVIETPSASTPPAPQPTDDHGPEPEPTNENRPSPRPTNENRPEPEPTKDKESEPKPTKDKESEPRPLSTSLNVRKSRSRFN